MTTGWQRLQEETFIQTIRWLDEVDSTNTYALQMTSADGDLPILVGATRQLDGRGRGKNTWWARSGSLTHSILLDPLQLGISPSRWPQLSLSLGASVCTTLSAQVPEHDVRLKWPNDVYVNGRKIAGILVESVPQRPGLVVAGIGINVNNSLASAPPEVRERAISLIDLLGQETPLIDLLIRLLQQIEEDLRALGRDDPRLIQRCRESCFLTGRIVTVKNIATEVTGTCAGIDDDGALLLLTSHGPERCLAGVVTEIQ
jgi:BirA family biotin operon repressor/biotin-[acetyl-CoA-carboxylase] ligase